jgi:hypothetical protein
MGRQTQFYMLRDDGKAFLDYVQNRDPVVVIRRDSKSPEILEERSPWEKGGSFCLWNQSLLTALNRQFVPESKVGPTTGTMPRVARVSLG